jgi:PsaD
VNLPPLPVLGQLAQLHILANYVSTSAGVLCAHTRYIGAFRLAQQGRTYTTCINTYVLPMLQVQYLHPKDGVYPEKVNAGRSAVNANKGRIGENLNPVQIKFSGKMVSIELRWPCTAGALSHWQFV